MNYSVETSIQKLPQSVISAIAAGEVIERPAYVIKELVENALDAYATQIDIEVTTAGLDQIKVSDNGHGMSAADLCLAPLLHTTSKLRHLRQLEFIDTNGFRGEALASICAVSRVTIQTKQPQAKTGYSLHIDHGQSADPQPVGLPPGTTITVDGLFDQIPVRKKFLQSKNAELQTLSQVVTQLSLAHPQVAFSLQSDGKHLMSLPTGQTLKERIASLFGTDVIDETIPVSYHHSFIKISGFLGKSSLARKNAYQHLSLNNRSISHRQISKAVKNVYGSLLSDGHSPWFVLHLTLPPNVFDINIHPRKETAAFLNESELITLFNQVLVDTLSDYLAEKKRVPSTALLNSDVLYNDKHVPLPELHSHLKESIQPWSPKHVPPETHILQIDNTYLLVPQRGSFTIIDQHAAHERILFEQFKAAFQNSLRDEDGIARVQQLEEPFLLELPAGEVFLWTEHGDELTKIGFEWELFSQQTIKISAIPNQLNEHDLGEVLPNMLADISAGRKLSITDQQQHTLAYLACRSAIMAGDPLTQDERRNLIQELAATENAATCPHGRPTYLEYSQEKLAKLFKRS